MTSAEWDADSEDLDGLSPEFLARIAGLSAAARRGFIELERGAMELDAIEAARREAGEDPAATLEEAFTGRRRRDVVLAREQLHAAARRYERAIRAARAVGYSWAELAAIVGVSRQALRQRFG